MDYNLLRVFSKVSELGSFTRAAKALNYPKSRISRAVARLEREIDLQLIRRTTRRTTLTESGEAFYRKISPLLASIDYELIELSNQNQVMSGVIRVTAPQDIGYTLLPAIICAFHRKHPQVRFEAIITNEFLDLTKENIDVAFRAGKLTDSSMIQKKLLSDQFILVGAPVYLETHGAPSNFKEFSRHKFLSFKRMEKEFFKKEIQITPSVTSDSMPMLLNMVAESYGIAILPEFICKELLDSGKIVRLMPNWKSRTGSIHLLYHPGKRTSRKVKEFIEVAIAHFV